VFILVSLKTSPLQVVQGRLFGIGQSKAHPWLHVLVVVLRATLRTRSWTALAQRLGVAEADAGALVEPKEESPPPSDLSRAPALAPASPLWATLGPNGAARAAQIRLSRRAVIVARKSATR
jgi:hypothetical protein